MGRQQWRVELLRAGGANLRQITLRGDRQVFFATANEKVASLFERKFDFLGPEFRRIDSPAPTKFILGMASFALLNDLLP